MSLFKKQRQSHTYGDWPVFNVVRSHCVVSYEKSCVMFFARPSKYTVPVGAAGAGAVVVVGVVEVVGVGAGAGGGATATVGADAACAEPFLFVAVTTTRTVYPTSPDETPYVEPAASASDAHSLPAALQCCHW